MQNQNDVFTIKLTAAIVVDGEIATAGEVVELSRREAQNILARGLGELHGDKELDGEDGVDLSRLNKAQLVALAQSLGVISVGDGNTKAEIVAAIEAAKEEQAD